MSEHFMKSNSSWLTLPNFISGWETLRLGVMMAMTREKAYALFRLFSISPFWSMVYSLRTNLLLFCLTLRHSCLFFAFFLLVEGFLLPRIIKRWLINLASWSNDNGIKRHSKPGLAPLIWFSVSECLKVRQKSNKLVLSDWFWECNNKLVWSRFRCMLRLSWKVIIILCSFLSQSCDSPSLNRYFRETTLCPAAFKTWNWMDMARSWAWTMNPI